MPTPFPTAPTTPNQARDSTTSPIHGLRI